MLNYNGKPTGTFREADWGCWFTYRETSNAWALSHGLRHEIDVLDQIRFGNVLRTVAHVCVDENERGAPVLVSWKLRKHEPINA